MIFSLRYKIAPFFASINPVSVSQSSFWPLPATPATPRISPVLISKEISSSATPPSLLSTVRSTIFKIVSLFSISGRSIFRLIGRPTISSVSFFSSHPAVSTVSMLFPFRRIVTRSLIERTSFNLWVIIIIAQPCSRIRRRILNSRSVSCGVRTADGSSRIRIWAPLYNTFRISTVCFSLTDMS